MNEKCYMSVDRIYCILTMQYKKNKQKKPREMLCIAVQEHMINNQNNKVSWR